MQCFTCNQYYDTKIRVPVIDHEGTTMCEPCYMEKSNSDKKNCTINRQLIKLLGKCPNHIDVDLSLLDIKSKKRMCPKCVIFSKEKKKYEHCVFVEIDTQANKLDNILANNIQQIKHKIAFIQDNIVQKLKIQMEKTKNQVLSTLEQEYKRYLSILNESYHKEQKKVHQKVKSIENEFNFDTMPSVKRLNDLKFTTEKIDMNDMVLEAKYEAVADLVSGVQTLDQVQSNLYAQSILTKNSLKEFSNEYSCGFTITIERKQEKNPNMFNVEEQLLLSKSNSKKVEQEEITYMDFSLDLTKSSYNFSSATSTQRTITQTSSNSEFVTQLKPKSKNCLTIHHLAQLNKIQTNVRQIVCKGLDISNTDGKKVLSSISKSFVKSLDLSGNKISNIFLKDLNKANIGKYLKTINLQRNQIDGKDNGVHKKIQLLKSQGVTILI